jgi:cobalt-zinc-cadmium efflux system membrane fusion protein
MWPEGDVHIPTAVKYSVAAAVVAGVVAAGWLTRETWQPWLSKAAAPSAADPSERDHHAPAERVTLSPQAAANLHLVSQPLKPETYWRTLQVPGIVVDRPGQSDRGVSAPVVGVVAAVHAHPGDTVRTGDVLFTLRLTSELVHNTQVELFKTTQEIQFNREQLDRLSAPGASIPPSKIIELENQERRLKGSALAYRQELLTRGLISAQIDAAAQGQFVTEVTVTAPVGATDTRRLVATGVPSSTGADDLRPLAYEVEDLKVQLGDQVQAGQVLLILANHQSLYIEGHGFKQEAALLERAAQEGWAIQAEFVEDVADAWPATAVTFRIHHLSNTIDPVSRTLPFFLPLANQSRSYDRDGRTFLVWRYRPGQRVRLHVPVERFDNVFVLPAEAVAREGPEVYVFRQNGDGFDRKPVRLLYEDRRFVVLANDGSIAPGQYVARAGAASLNRVLKAQSATGLPAGFHVHADGTVHGAH